MAATTFTKLQNYDDKKRGSNKMVKETRDYHRTIIINTIVGN